MAKKAGVKKKRPRTARDRELAARKGVITRTTDPGSLFRQAVNAIHKYKTSGRRRDYARFRNAKRNLYKVLPGLAPTMMQDASEAAGWDVTIAMKFAKLS